MHELPFVQPWLPDGVVFIPKIPIWYTLEGLGMENIGIFYGHLVYFTAMWYSLRPFGIFCGHLVYFTAIWII
jgi:hypothetical protein